MSNGKNWRHLLLLSSFVQHCLFSVLLLNFFGIVNLVSSAVDKFEFQSQICLSRTNAVVPSTLKIKPLQFSSKEVVGYTPCSWDDNTSSTTGTFAPRSPKTTTKCWYRKLLDMINEKCL